MVGTAPALPPRHVLRDNVTVIVLANVTDAPAMMIGNGVALGRLRRGRREVGPQSRD